MFIKIGVSSINPSLFTSLRFLIATITLFIFSKFKKVNLKINLNDLTFIILVSIVDVLLPQILISNGEKWIASTITSIILSSSPIFTFIFAHILLKDEKITLYKLIFVVTGFIGVFIIFYKELLNGNNYFMLKGFFLIILASILYGMGVILLKKLSLKLNLYASVFYLVLFGFLSSIPFVILFKGFSNSKFTILSTLSVFYVGIVLQSFAYTYFLNAIKKFGASKTSYVGYLVPLFSIIYGSIFLKEIITINVFIGGFLIILSAYFIEKDS